MGEAAPTRALVLVVDDDELIREFATHVLRGMGADVAFASDGLEAIDYVSANLGEVELVLLDLVMPNMDGPDALAGIRAIDADVPVVLSTGYGEEEAVRRTEGLDVSGVLRKPYKPEELRASVARWIPATTSPSPEPQ